jgi:hypothetical protein
VRGPPGYPDADTEEQQLSGSSHPSRSCPVRPDDAVPDHIGVHVLAALREALSDVVRRARAKTIEVTVRAWPAQRWWPPWPMTE